MSQNDPFETQSTESDPGELAGIINFVGTLYRYRWYVLTITAAAFAIGMFYAVTLKDQYKSTSSILIDDSKVQTTAYREVAGASGTIEPRGMMDTQLVVAVSAPVLLSVAKETDVKKYFGVDSDQAASEILQLNTRAYQHKKTNIFHIEVVDYDPKWAAKLVNSTTEHCIKENVRQSLMSNEQLLKLLPGGVESDPTAILQKMADPYFIESLPSVQQSETLQALKKDKLRMEGELAQLKSRYTDANPIVIEMLKNIEHNEQQIKLETAGIVAGLKRNLSSEFKSTNMSIFEYGKPAEKPFAPNRPQVVLIFGLLGFALSSVLSVFMGVIMSTVNSEEDLAQLVTIPYLGHLPVVDGKVKTDSIKELLGIQSIRDAIAMLHTALIFSMPKDRNKLIMITSCVPGEGKSSISALLAHTMAALGTDKNRKMMGTEDRILLVEADIRKPGIAIKLGLENLKDRPGLADYLIGTANYDQIVASVPWQENLDIITAGSVSKNPESLFTSTAFDDLVRMVEQKYTRVIFDSPPFLSIPEASIISQKMHGTLFVVGSGMIRRKVLIRALEKFKLLNTTLFGTALNRLDTQHKKHYHGYKYVMENPKN